MKIKSLEFENFRNYKDHNKIDFSTDGKVDIIYGANGAGKTTFQQLIKWILYGRIRFNKTTNDYLYNLEVAHNAKINDSFRVYGKITFVHKGVNYEATRDHWYKKTLLSCNEIKTSFTILYEKENHEWDRVQDPVDLIEKLLPSGLENYFFLEGENMISDLKVKGKASAGNLRDALYLMLDLAVYDRAIKIIGSEDLKSTVIGSLFIKQANMSSNSEIKELGYKLSSAQTKRDDLIEEIDELNNQINEKDDIIATTSEMIGAAKSQEEYEKRRRENKTLRESYLKEIQNKYVEFGKKFSDDFIKIVISNVTDKAADNIKAAENTQFIHGLNKVLLDSLLDRDTCICGNKLSEREKDIIKGYYKLLPPNGYEAIHADFLSTAKQWKEAFNKDEYEEIIKSTLEYFDNVSKADKNIIAIDEEMKKYKGIDELVVSRKQAERDKDILVRERDKKNSELTKAEILVRKLNNLIKVQTNQLNENESIRKKIDLMTQVSNDFKDMLQTMSKEYSEKLQVAIQDLVDKMLVAKRTVKVSQDFELQVVDSYDDESKSDGQLATISFAYIGGIFKILNENNIIDNTEYPLIMDAPFSKLNKESIEKVIEIIPQYAPQMIILIKDDVLNFFDENEIGKIYTIESNDEQNVAIVKEGKLWQ